MMIMRLCHGMSILGGVLMMLLMETAVEECRHDEANPM